MWKHAFVVLSLTLAGLAFGVSEVQACACVIGSGAPAGLSREEQAEHYRKSYRDHVRQQFGEAYAIFSAEAIAVGRDTVTFRLDDVWKGELPREMSSSSCLPYAGANRIRFQGSSLAGPLSRERLPPVIRKTMTLW